MYCKGSGTGTYQYLGICFNFLFIAGINNTVGTVPYRTGTQGLCSQLIKNKTNALCKRTVEIIQITRFDRNVETSLK